jgi:hypothetical protein
LGVAAAERALQEHHAQHAAGAPLGVAADGWKVGAVRGGWRREISRVHGVGVLKSVGRYYYSLVSAEYFILDLAAILACKLAAVQ